MGTNLFKFLTILLLPVLLTACDGLIAAQGVVHDLDGKPIPGALVTLNLFDRPTDHLQNPEVKSNPDGNFDIRAIWDMFPISKNALRVSKEGYKPAEYKIWGMQNNIEFSLAPEKSAAQSGAIRKEWEYPSQRARSQDYYVAPNNP